MTLLAVVVACLVQDPVADPLAGLAPNHRVVVRLKNGHRFAGQVIFVGRGRITIDITLDHPAVSGTITFPRGQIERIEQLGTLTAEEIRRRAEEKLRALEAAREADARNLERLRQWREEQERLSQEEELAQQAQRLAEEDEQRRRQEAIDAAARAIYAEFSPSEGWNQARYETLAVQSTNPGTPLTERERRFFENYALWQRGRQQALQQSEPSPKGGGGASSP